MGRPVVLGASLKMYFGHQQTLTWARAVARLLEQSRPVAEGRVRAFVAPSYPALKDVVSIMAPHAVAAQDVAAYEAGAHTGEVSAAELAEIGVRLAEIGHAERRRSLGDTAEVIRDKCARALEHGLEPLLCVGEPDQVSPGTAAGIVIEQVCDALRLTGGPGHEDRPVTVAYEPWWAIGAAEPASADHVVEVCTITREVLADRLPGMTLLYGGSAGPGTLGALGGSVDGLFLGRMVHDPDRFGEVLAEAGATATRH